MGVFLWLVWVNIQWSSDGSLKHFKQQVIFSSRFSACKQFLLFHSPRMGSRTATGGHWIPQRPPWMMETRLWHNSQGLNHSWKCAPQSSAMRIKSNINCPLRVLSWPSGPLPQLPTCHLLLNCSQRPLGKTALPWTTRAVESQRNTYW